MKISDLVQFRGDLFFDGAVQLKWADENTKRAEEAARAFVFHGPKYHGVGKATGADEAYQLTDTATLLSGLLNRIASAGKAGSSPFSLAIAGYGSGKSHFAVALTSLLRNTSEALTNKILENLALADNDACKSVTSAIRELKKPALVVALDGTANFNLGNALSGAVFGQLRSLGIDDSPLRELSPRFEDAANFTKRNYSIRATEFSSKFPKKNIEEIVSCLESRDEDAYSLVDEIYFNANGAHIPVEGRESAQDLIATFCECYCGTNGMFSRLIIIFDEFGRFLEYVAERPALAGDSALQQIFQGVQDDGERVHFIGFIQYELKAYLARLAHRDAMHIQKYITRFDVSKKYYLSSNLETIFAHLLDKRDESRLDGLLASEEAECTRLHHLMSSLLPGFRQLPVWSHFPDFFRIIVKGCWPLHPMATWFLTRQQDVVQSRSAITFVRTAMEAFGDVEADNRGRLQTISGSRIIVGDLLTEMLAAERAHGGVVIDNLKATFDKYAAQFNTPEIYLLIAVAVAKKMRVVSESRSEYDLLLTAISGLNEKEYLECLVKLENNLGVLEWSDEHKQYELITDAVTRGQYQKDLRKRIREVSAGTVKQIFVARAKGWADTLLLDVSTSFAQENEISTQEWSFTSHLASDETLSSAIELAFSDWSEAVRPDQAKGQLVFTYVDKDVDSVGLQEKAKNIVGQQLKKHRCLKAPVWIVFLGDMSGRLQDYLRALYVIDEGFDPVERDRYARFIPEERESSQIGLRATIREQLASRVVTTAGFEVTGGRLAQDAGSIFRDVYSKVLPFPFDGFSSKSGNGAADAATVARALFGKEVSAAWLDVQKVQLQNRVKLLLGRSWGVLDFQGRVSNLPANQEVKEVLTDLESRHRKSSDRTLADDLRCLIMPPYGCNLSSAAILLGLLVSRTTPLRAIHYEGQGIGLTDWLRVAFDKQGKFLQTAALENTSLIFLKEDALARWQAFLNDWEGETTLERVVEKYHSALERRKSDPIPELLEANFKYLRDKAVAVEAELAQYDGLISEIESRFEAAARKNNVGEVFAVAEKLLRKKSDIQLMPAKWTEEQREHIESLLSDVTDVLKSVGESWILMQSCNSPMMVADFRSRMERNDKTLNTLGLSQLAKVANQHKQKSISNVEIRYQFSMAISEASDLSRLPEPGTSTRIREVRDSIDRAEKLIVLLEGAKKTLGDGSDIVQLIDSLKAKQKLLRDFIQKRQSLISDSFNVVPNNCDEADQLLVTLNFLKQQFGETKDIHDIEARRHSVTKLTSVFRTLDLLDFGPDSIRESITSSATSSMLDETSANGVELEEYDDERQWIDQCFVEYTDRRYVLAISRSKDFSASVLADLSNVIRDSKRLIGPDALARFSDLPHWLSSSDRGLIESAVTNAMMMRAKLVQEQEEEEGRRWLREIEDSVANLKQMSNSECVAMLAKTQTLPSRIDHERIAAIRAAVQEQLDENDISDLVSRIMKLSKKMKDALLVRLSSIFPNGSS